MLLGILDGVFIYPRKKIENVILGYLINWSMSEIGREFGENIIIICDRIFF